MPVTGRSWEEKIKAVREKMAEKKADALIISALDEIACKYLPLSFMNIHTWLHPF